MDPKEYIVFAAGGNATAIALVDAALNRGEYESRGRELMQRTESSGVEQAGFLHLEARHFEMSGGEFCGNAARSAAMLIAKLSGETQFDFTMSGYEGSVEASVEIDDRKAEVTCTFPNLKTTANAVSLPGGGEGMLVDLGGIVHVLTREPFVNDRAVYEPRHREITEALGLSQRSAVGVCWIESVEQGLLMHPVVWVRAIDSFFYETACGSGSIAVAAATHQADILQPSGQMIRVNITEEGTDLSSSMEISHAG